MTQGEQREQSQPFKAADACTLVAIVGLALFLRLWLLGLVPVIETDGFQYVAIARRFQQSGFPFDPLFHPLYPVCIAVVQPLVGDYEFSGRLVSALFGSALLVPAYALSRPLVGRSAALLSAGLLAIHPGLVRSSTAVMTEATYLFWLTLGVWIAWRGVERAQIGRLAVSGLCLGLAYLTRPEAALYLIGMAALSVVAGQRSGHLRTRLLGAAVAVLAFILVTAPYLVYLHRSFGYWTLSGKIRHVLVQDTGLPMGVDQQDLGFIVQNVSVMVRQVLENAALFEKYAFPELFPGFLSLFLLPGLLAEVRQAGWVHRQGLLLAASMPPFATLAFHVESRVFLPILPYLVPLVASGILVSARWIRPGDGSRRWSVILAGFAIVTVLPFALRPAFRQEPEAGVYQRVAAWVSKTQPTDALLMDRKPFIAFYTGHPFAPLIEMAPERLASAARDAGVTLVILDSRTLSDRPRLLPLVYEPPPPGLEYLRDFEMGPGWRVRILRVSRHA